MISGRSSLLISDYILMRAAGLGQRLTPFELIKRVVIAHGRYLACTGDPLIVDRIEAWKHGPVIPVLYHELKIYGDDPVPALRYCGTPTDKSPSREQSFNDVLSEGEQYIIDGVVDDYKDWNMSQIYQLCHEEGSPWKQCYTGGHGVEIPDYIIKEYYEHEMVAQ